MSIFNLFGGGAGVPQQGQAQDVPEFDLGAIASGYFTGGPAGAGVAALPGILDYGNSSTGTMNIPGVGSNANWFNRIGGMGGLADLAGGLGSLGGIFSNIKGINAADDARKLQEQQLKFMQDVYNRNLEDQYTQYNQRLARLADTAQSFYEGVPGMEDRYGQSYIDENTLNYTRV